jgi:hypothetical protein
LLFSLPRGVFYGIFRDLDQAWNLLEPDFITRKYTVQEYCPWLPLKAEPDSKRLTKSEKNFIFKTVKYKIISAITLIFLVSLLTPMVRERGISATELSSIASGTAHPQETKKPKYDYMSTVLSRDTKPLGLKEDIALKKFLNQSSIKWAIRAGERHILD